MYKDWYRNPLDVLIRAEGRQICREKGCLRCANWCKRELRCRVKREWRYRALCPRFVEEVK